MYELGQAYNTVVQLTLASFADQAEEETWRTLLLADALREDGRLSAAFRLYRQLLPAVPESRAAHDSLVAIYEKTNHADWAAAQKRRAAAVTVDCAKSAAECAFNAGKLGEVMTTTAGKVDPWPRYWRIRAATALAQASFAKLDALPDSRERRVMRAELARAQRRYVDAVSELEAALALAPDDPELLGELALSHYLARNYEQALAVTKTLLGRAPDSPGALSLSGQSLLELQRLGEAVPLLERALKLDPEDDGARAALGRAYVQKGDALAAIPLLEASIDRDQDGAVHFQLARAYQATGKADKAKPLLQKYQQLQQQKRARDADATEAAITPPE